jgi:hypothetical protein
MIVGWKTSPLSLLYGMAPLHPDVNLDKYTKTNSPWFNTVDYKGRIWEMPRIGPAQKNLINVKLEYRKIKLSDREKEG